MSTVTPTVLVNGYARQSLPVTDRGFAYGHGLFETIRVKAGVPLLWQAHLERLRAGCEQLQIGWPGDLERLLAEETDQLCAGGDAMVKLVITAGSGGLGYRLPTELHPLRIVARYPLPNYPAAHYAQGIRLCTCQQRLALQPRLAGLKHLNRLEQVLASAERQTLDVEEGVMLDQQARVIEGTRTNIFAIDRQQRLHTPAIDECGIAGVMRRYILEQAKEMGLDTREGRYSQQALQRMPELFVCNSLIGIWPVAVWGEQRYLPGPVTERLTWRVKELFGEV